MLETSSVCEESALLDISVPSFVGGACIGRDERQLEDSDEEEEGLRDFRDGHHLSKVERKVRRWSR